MRKLQLSVWFKSLSLPTLLPLLERDKLLTAGEMMGPVDRVRAEGHHNYD